MIIRHRGGCNGTTPRCRSRNMANNTFSESWLQEILRICRFADRASHPPCKKHCKYHVFMQNAAKRRFWDHTMGGGVVANREPGSYMTSVRMKPTWKQPRWCLHCRWYDFQSTLWEVLSMEVRRCFHQWQPWDMGWSVFFLMNMWYYDMTKESCWYYDMSLDFMMRLIRREYEIMLKSLYRWYLRLRTTWYRCIDTKWYKHSKCWPVWKSFEPKSSESL